MTLQFMTDKESQVVTNDFQPVGIPTFANLAALKASNPSVFDEASVVITKISDKIDTTRVNVYKITSPDGTLIGYVPTL